MSDTEKRAKEGRERECLKGSGKGLFFDRHHTQTDGSWDESIKWKNAISKITNQDESVVFEMDGIEVPTNWSQLSIDILASKYFRKRGVGGEGVGETSLRQTIQRIVHTMRMWGTKAGGYFASEEDAETFEEELSWLLANQHAAFNSPVWFNCGLSAKYGIKGAGGNWAWDEERERPHRLEDNYERPQCSACFIQKVEDDLMSIFSLAQNEARLFKYGSGTGTNFSPLRGKTEKLSGGGSSSGLMSFLKVLDSGAGATKSGGTTRRAAKMVCLDVDHPEILEFINWKVVEEKKAKVLMASGYEGGIGGEAYETVGGQNANNAVRLTDDFLKGYEEDKTYWTTFRTTGEGMEELSCRKVMGALAEATWQCADPGVQYDSTINEWHTCKATDRINASNPCSEFMFLDNTACNLSSINLLKYQKEDGSFDIGGYNHAIRLLFTAQEILVDLSSYPTEEIAKNSHDFRPLGLGYANLGGLLMARGIPYDSEEGRGIAAALTGILTGCAYSVSAELAESKGSFAAYPENATSMGEVMNLHRQAAYSLEIEHTGAALWNEATRLWDGVVKEGAESGFRNAQATVLAPTGTIGLLMDCDTTGIEPDYALCKIKKLAGGGYFKIINRTVRRGLTFLGYAESDVKEILQYVQGFMSWDNPSPINTDSLKKKGFSPKDLARLESKFLGAFSIKEVLTVSHVGEDFLEARGWEGPANEEGFSMMEALGFDEEQVEKANEIIFGRMTVEGAPGLKEEHLAVFDCANKCGHGERYIPAMGHVRMMAATQPFLSGAISKTVNLPASASVQDIEDIYIQGWKLGLKAVAVYRDGSKGAQPLQSGKEIDQEKTTEEAHDEAPKTDTVQRSRRQRLPRRRQGFTSEARIGGHKIFVRTGEYEVGEEGKPRLGEIFLDMHKEGAGFRSLLNCFAIAVSLGLQYGVPLKEFVDAFTFTRFEPYGMVDHPNIKKATSVVDFIFKLLGMEYLGRTDFVQIPPADPPVERTRDATLPKQEPLFSKEKGSDDALDIHLGQMMGDAPLCDQCGHITVRNGTCYRCLNCGNSMGCS